MNLTCIGFGAVIIVAGILFAFRKLLPKAWKEMSDGEKAEIKIKPLCVNIGIMIIVCGGILLAKGLWAAFAGKGFIIAMTVWVALSVADVLFISKSNFYRNKKEV